jgi:peptidoglycan/LPS O-acetylase OafA/YrhL
MRYIKGLDTLRAFAVIFVLIWHFIPRHEIKTFLGIIEQFFLPTGVFGVTLFFVLSGYLITSILLIARDENNDNMMVIKNFIIRRVLRIFPIYYLSLVVLWFIQYSFSEGELPYLFTYTSNLFMFKNLTWSNFGHSWSLAVEEQFYLI